MKLRMKQGVLAAVASLLLLIMSAGSRGADHGQLPTGTWTVTLKFPVCNTECPCPEGMTWDVGIPLLRSYVRDLRADAMLEVGNSLGRKAAMRSWGSKQKNDNHSVARY